MAATQTYKLQAIKDLREKDDWTGEIYALQAGQGNICDRCGREHAKVYQVVRIEDGKEFNVGSTCCSRLFDGWEPEKAAITAAKKAAKKQSEEKTRQRMLALVRPIVDEVATLAMPRIVVLEERPDAYITTMIWGVEGSKVKAWGSKQDGLTSERRATIKQAWIKEQVHNRIEALVQDANKCYKLFIVACQQIGY